MRSVVVCESWFGNTERVARAVADELGRYGEATVGGGPPTHVHGMSSSLSRKSAIEQSGVSGLEPGPGARGWFESLPEDLGGKAAAFDTRIEKSSMLTGSAAKGVAKRLRQHGFELVAEPESFFVLDTGGPLKEGELERAAYWAQDLVAALGLLPTAAEEPITA
jgi:hypothetical protein